MVVGRQSTVSAFAFLLSLGELGTLDLQAAYMSKGYMPIQSFG